MPNINTRPILKIQNATIASKASGEFQADGKYKERPLALAKGQNDPGRVKRITTFLDGYVGLAQTTHKENLQKSTANEETITRFVFDEFCLYTKDTPLSIEEYKTIIRHLSEKCAHLPPNIHFNIASLPVLWPNGVVQNCALYVQSPTKVGEKPLIHHMTKVNSSDIDPQYGYIETNGTTVLYPLAGDDPQRDLAYKNNPNCMPSYVLSDTPVQCNDVNQVNYALKITTAAGNTFLQASDICLDHAMGVGKENTHDLMRQLSNQGQFVPLFASHTISSKTIQKNHNNTIAEPVHADITMSGMYAYQPEAQGKPTNNMTGFGGGSNFQKYKSYDVGILSGNDLKTAVNHNHRNNFAFHTNYLWGTKTLLQLSAEKALKEGTPSSKTYERLATLVNHQASIDVKDGQGDSLRNILHREIAQPVKNPALPSVICATRSYECDEPSYQFIRSHIMSNNAAILPQAQSTDNVKLLSDLLKYAQSRNDAMFYNTINGRVGELLKLSDESDDNALYKMLKSQIDFTQLIQTAQRSNNSGLAESYAYTIAKREMAKPSYDINLINHLINICPNFTQGRFANKTRVGEHMMRRCLEANDVTLYNTLKKVSCDIPSAIRLSPNPSALALKALMMELNSSQPNVNLIQSLVKDYPGIERAQLNNQGLTYQHLAAQKNISCHPIPRHTPNTHHNHGFTPRINPAVATGFNASARAGTRTIRNPHSLAHNINTLFKVNNFEAHKKTRLSIGEVDTVSAATDSFMRNR